MRHVDAALCWHDHQNYLQEGFVDLFKGNRSKAFKAHYLQMWDEVLCECHEQEVLLDDTLLDKLVNLLIGLSWCGLSSPSDFPGTSAVDLRSNL